MRVKISSYCIVEANQISIIEIITNEGITIEGISVFTEDAIFDFYYDMDLYSVDEAKEDFEDRMKQVLVEGFIDMTYEAFSHYKVYCMNDSDE